MRKLIIAFAAGASLVAGSAAAVSAATPVRVPSAAFVQQARWHDRDRGYWDRDYWDRDRHWRGGHWDRGHHYGWRHHRRYYGGPAACRWGARGWSDRWGYWHRCWW